ncbi:MAG: polysaccharide deacetylase family protein [Peptococcaceae bacterium]|nr:polysaccharide deacetylase family protein [Peptococcaceae bacterium]
MSWFSTAAGTAAGFAGLWACYGPLPTFYFKYRKKSAAIEKKLILTFDDGPDPRYTPQLLDLLAKEKVCCTFFLLAEKAKAHPELVRRILAEGHGVGFHGVNHGNLWFKGPAATAKDFFVGPEMLKEAGCTGLCRCRPPYGNLNLCALYCLRRSGMKLLLWDVMVQDWRQDAEPELLLKKLFARSRNGAVICLHDSGEGSAAAGAPLKMIEALGRFLPEMKKRGYRFALPDEKTLFSPGREKAAESGKKAEEKQ